MQQPEHNVGDHEDPIAGQTWLISFVGVALLIVIFLSLTALYYNYAAGEETTMVINREPVEFLQLTESQAAQLEGEPRWEARQVLGAEEGEMEHHLVIPIDHAMNFVVQEYGQESSKGSRDQGIE